MYVYIYTYAYMYMYAHFLLMYAYIHTYAHTHLSFDKQRNLYNAHGRHLHAHALCCPCRVFGAGDSGVARSVRADRNEPQHLGHVRRCSAPRGGQSLHVCRSFGVVWGLKYGGWMCWWVPMKYGGWMCWWVPRLVQGASRYPLTYLYLSSSKSYAYPLISMTIQSWHIANTRQMSAKRNSYSLTTLTWNSIWLWGRDSVWVRR